MQERGSGMVPHLVVNDAAAAIDFYGRAFGAQEVMRIPAEDGKRLMHAALLINGAPLYLRDDFPEYCQPDGPGQEIPPTRSGSTSLTLHLDVPDCDSAVDKAAAAGATVIMPPWDAFWGDRYAKLADPFGHVWSLAHPLADRAPPADPAAD